jgi:hypothetical protein
VYVVETKEDGIVASPVELTGLRDFNVEAIACGKGDEIRKRALLYIVA